MPRQRRTSELSDRGGTKGPARGLDVALAALAGRQFGVVARLQLVELGFSDRHIRHRLEAGRLHRLHAGVYAVGHTRVCREGRWLAAVLACGEDAVLSHRSAAALWGIIRYEGRVEVTARHAHRRGSAVVARRSALEGNETTEHRGIPTTSVERTLIDLGLQLKPHELDRAVREAEVQRIVDFGELRHLLDRHQRRRGTRHLRLTLVRMAESMARTRSDLEDRFRAIVLGAGLPTPRFNETIALGEMTVEADVVWPEHKVIVELDGYAAHATRDQFRNDRARDRAAQFAGWLTLRYTWYDIDMPAARRLKALLSARTPPRSDRPRSAARCA